MGLSKLGNHRLTHTGNVLTLRFDDRLETALRQATGSEREVMSNWRQLIDILSQNPQNFPYGLVATGLTQARRLLPQTILSERLASVRSLSGRILSPPLVQLLAFDVASVASAAIMGAHLSDQQWADLIPQLPVRARGFLRNRNDLGPLARRTLAIWSSADFVLTDNSDQAATAIPAAVDTTQQAGMRISDIVERIERLRRERENSEAPQLPLEGGDGNLVAQTITEIRFETDDLGTVSWVEGAPRGAIIGVGISEPAFADGPGPDAFGAAAFRQRMPLENVRMRLCGALIVEGDWRINAAPFFDAFSGRFRGYRGIFRRPNVAENAQIHPEAPENADELQQLVHELRTPLGAIIGFSEIIEQQLFGPVSSDYRVLARNIMADAERLLAGFDDLSMAARIETGRFVADQGTTDCTWLANRLADRLQGLSDSLEVTLNLAKADPVRAFAIDSELTERLFSRLLSAVIIGCEPGEELGGRFRTERGAMPLNRFVLSLPKKLQTLSEEELLGSMPITSGIPDQSPLLGLGFSLRLVRSLANNVKGDLRFYNETLILSLPAVQDGEMHYRGEERE
jgi:His Kinase A (phospho-acceptor) domain